MKSSIIKTLSFAVDIDVRTILEKERLLYQRAKHPNLCSEEKQALVEWLVQSYCNGAVLIINWGYDDVANRVTAFSCYDNLFKTSCWRDNNPPLRVSQLINDDDALYYIDSIKTIYLHSDPKQNWMTNFFHNYRDSG
jgi:hypothetical protein